MSLESVKLNKNILEKLCIPILIRKEGFIHLSFKIILKSLVITIVRPTREYF